VAQLPLFESSEWIVEDDERGRITYSPRFVEATTAAAWFAELRGRGGGREMRRGM
jgi:hypothetical protein